jgi:hypothetical protein
VQQLVTAPGRRGIERDPGADRDRRPVRARGLGEPPVKTIEQPESFGG